MRRLYGMEDAYIWRYIGAAFGWSVAIWFAVFFVGLVIAGVAESWGLLAGSFFAAVLIAVVYLVVLHHIAAYLVVEIWCHLRRICDALSGLPALNPSVEKRLNLGMAWPLVAIGVVFLGIFTLMKAAIANVYGEPQSDSIEALLLEHSRRNKLLE